MNKRQSDHRARTLLDARIVFNNRFSLIECTVRNLSKTGARIAFPHPIDIPSEFELEIPKKNMSVRARVAWSDGKEHGVRFLEEARERDHTVSDSEKNGVQEILSEARVRIARAMGVPPECVRLVLEIAS